MALTLERDVVIEVEGGVDVALPNFPGQKRNFCAMFFPAVIAGEGFSTIEQAQVLVGLDEDEDFVIIAGPTDVAEEGEALMLHIRDIPGRLLRVSWHEQTVGKVLVWIA